MANSAGASSFVDLAGLTRAHIEALNDHDVEKVMTTVVDQVLYRVLPGQVNGAPALREYWVKTFKRIPDIHLDLRLLMKDEQRNEVFIRAALTGTDSDSYCLEPGDESISEQLGIFFRFDEAGRITEAVGYPEASSLNLFELARAHVGTENRIDLEPQKRAELAMSTVADDGSYLIYPTGQELSGREQIMQYYADSFRALPDMHIDIQHMMKDEQKRQVLCQYRITGLDKGHLQGLEPTNQRIEYYGNILYQFTEEGKVAKEITYFEKTEVLTSMGLIRDTQTPLGLMLLIFPQSPFYTLRVILANLFRRRKSG